MSIVDDILNEPDEAIVPARKRSVVDDILSTPDEALAPQQAKRVTTFDDVRRTQERHNPFGIRAQVVKWTGDQNYYNAPIVDVLKKNDEIMARLDAPRLEAERYQNQAANIDIAQGAVKGLGTGATFGLSDLGAAGVEKLVAMHQGRGTEDLRPETNAGQWANTAGMLAGSLVPASVIGKAVPAIGQIANPYLRAAVEGALGNAAYQPAQVAENAVRDGAVDWGQEALNAGVNVGLGAIGGPLLVGAGRAIGKLADLAAKVDVPLSPRGEFAIPWPQRTTPKPASVVDEILKTSDQEILQPATSLDDTLRVAREEVKAGPVQPEPAVAPEPVVAPTQPPSTPAPVDMWQQGSNLNTSGSAEPFKQLADQNRARIKQWIGTEVVEDGQRYVIADVNDQGTLYGHKPGQKKLVVLDTRMKDLSTPPPPAPAAEPVQIQSTIVPQAPKVADSKITAIASRDARAEMPSDLRENNDLVTMFSDQLRNNPEYVERVSRLEQSREASQSLKFAERTAADSQIAQDREAMRFLMEEEWDKFALSHADEIEAVQFEAEQPQVIASIGKAQSPAASAGEAVTTPTRTPLDPQVMQDLENLPSDKTGKGISEDDAKRIWGMIQNEAVSGQPQKPTIPQEPPHVPTQTPAPQVQAQGRTEGVLKQPPRNMSGVMRELRDRKPRPIDKLYGKNGPTPEQAAQHAEQMKAWNREYRAASKEHKAFLEAQHTPSPQPARVAGQLPPKDTGQSLGAVAPGTGATIKAGEEVAAGIRSGVGAVREELAKVGGTIKQGWQTMARTPKRLLDRIPDESVVGRLRDVFTEPGTKFPEYGKMRREARGAINLAQEDAVRTYRPASMERSSGEDLYAIDRAMVGERPMESLPPEHRAWAQQTRAMLDASSRDLLTELDAAGLKNSPLYKSVERNLGKYMAEYRPRKGVVETARGWLKQKRLETARFKIKRDQWILRIGKKNIKLGSTHGIWTKEEAVDFFNQLKEVKKAKMIKADAEGVISSDLKDAVLKGERMKLVRPLTEAERVEMGYVRDPRVRWARTLIENETNVNNMRFFRAVKDRFVQTPGKDVDAAAWAKQAGLTRLPKSDRLGVLSEQYVPKMIAEDLTEMVAEKSMARKAWEAYLGAWKSSKTIYNMPTHFRNIYGNTIFADMAGANYHNPKNWKYYKQAVSEIVDKGPTYREMVKEGVLGTEYYGNEIRANIFQIPDSGAPYDIQFLQALGKMHRKLGNIYNGEDQIFKLAAFLKQKAAGKTTQEAAAHIQKWFPDYSTLSRLTKWWSRMPIGAPFVAFMDQATKIAGRAVVEHPIKVAKWMALPGAITAGSVAYLGMNSAEKEMIDQRRSYAEPILPVRDGKGRAMTLDMRYILPFANDLPSISGQDNRLNLPMAFSQPGVKSAVDLTYNRDSFGREIVKKNDPWFTTAAKYFGKNAAPLPTFFTYGVERMWDSLLGSKEENPALATAGAAFGINVRPPYVDRQTAFDLARKQKEKGRSGQEQMSLYDRYKRKNPKPITEKGLLQSMRRRAAEAKKSRN